MQRLVAALLVLALLFAGTTYANRVGAQMPRASSNTSVPCMLCESLVIGLELALTSAPNVTQAQVLDILRNVCDSSFFSKYQKECELFLDLDLDKVVAEIFNGEQGQLICSTSLPPWCPSTAMARSARRSAEKIMKRTPLKLAKLSSKA